MRKIILLSSVFLMSIGLGFGQSVEITPNKTSVEGIEPFLELKRLKNNSSIGALIDAYRSRESGGSAAPLTAGTSLLTVQTKGWNGVGYNLSSRMSIEASDNWGGSGAGTDFRLSLTRPTSTIPTEWLTIKGTGDVGLGSLNPGAKLDIPNGSSSDDYPSLRLLHTSSGFNRIAFETLGKTGNFIIASKIESNAKDSRLHLYSKDAPVGNILSLTGDGNIIHEGYTRLGSSSSSAPNIKMKKLTGTTASTEGTTAYIAHGLGSNKILAVDVHVEYTPSVYVPNSHLEHNDYQFDYIHDNTNIRVYTKAGNSANILSKPIVVLVTYEE